MIVYEARLMSILLMLKEYQVKQNGFLFGIFLYFMYKNKFWGRKRKHFILKC